MAYFELHDTMPDHPKVIRLARLLGKDRVLVIGHLVCLWTWTLRYRPSGDLDGMDEEAIADAARFAGDGPCAFVEALQVVKLIEKDDHGYHVHDWADYIKNYKKAKSDQARIADKRATVARLSQDASATKAVNGTERNGTERSLSPSPAAPVCDFCGGSGTDPASGETCPCQAPPSTQVPPPLPPKPRKNRNAFDGYSADFDAFWAECPNKQGKGDAWKAWNEVETLPPPQVLAAKMRDYAALVRREGRPPDKIKLPAGWLRDRRFDDDLTKRPSALPGFDPVTYARS